MTDDAFEARLREHFARQLPAEASPHLRDRVAAVPETPIPAMARPWLRVVMAAAATVAIGFVLVRVVLLDRGHGTIPVGGPSAPPSTAPLLLVPGDGVATTSVALWVWILALLLVGIVALGIRTLRNRHLPRWAGWALVAITTLVLLSAFGRSTSGSSLVDQGSFAPGPGWVEDTNGSADGLTSERGGMFMPGPSGSFSFALPVTNDGPLPVTIHGLALAPTLGGTDASPNLSPHFVALGSPEPGQTWTGALLPGPDGVAPFVAVTLWPGETTVLSILGVAGSCAATPGDVGVSGTSGFSSIPLVVDVAGFGYVEEVPITGVAIADADPCP